MYLPEQRDGLEKIIRGWKKPAPSLRFTNRTFLLLDPRMIALYTQKFLSNPAYREDNYDDYAFLLEGRDNTDALEDVYKENMSFAKTYLVIGRILYLYLKDLEEILEGLGKGADFELSDIREELVAGSLRDLLTATTYSLDVDLVQMRSAEDFSNGLRQAFKNNQSFAIRCPFGRRAKQVMGINPIRISPIDVMIGNPQSGALPSFIYNELYGHPKIGPAVPLLSC